jgi:spore coat protein U-like protein
MKRRIAVLLMLGTMLGAGLNAQQIGAQQTAQTTFKVTATVQAVCVVSAGDLNFGSYTSQSALLGQSGVVATCTPGSSYNIGLNAGSATGATINSRKMAGTPATNTLNYQLYRDSARSQIWGQTIGTDTVVDVGTGIAKSHTVFGTIPGGQLSPAGSYQDIVTVLITY